MIRDEVPHIVITARDFGILTEVVLARLPSLQAEEKRISKIQTLLSAASELNRALEVQTRYALVDHRGSHGANDLTAASQTLYKALEEYASELRALAEQYQDFAPSTEMTPEEFPVEAGV